MTPSERSTPYEVRGAPPSSFTVCATCGYGAWRQNYPCNRCGGLAPRTYLPTEVIRERVVSFGGFRRTEQGGDWIDRDDVLRMLDEYEAAQ